MLCPSAGIIDPIWWYVVVSVHKATTHDLPRALLTQQAHTLPPILITQQTISDCMQIHILCRPFANDGSLKTEGGGGEGVLMGKSARANITFRTGASWISKPMRTYHINMAYTSHMQHATSSVLCAAPFSDRVRCEARLNCTTNNPNASARQNLPTSGRALHNYDLIHYHGSMRVCNKYES